MNEFKFNLLTNKKPAGALVNGQSITYTLQVAQNYYATSVWFVCVKDGQSEFSQLPMEFVGYSNGYKQYAVTLQFYEIGLYWYHFRVEGRSTVIVQQGEAENSISLNSEPNNGFSQLVSRASAPSAINGVDGVIYHIFVDRFNRSGKVEPRKGLTLKKNWTDPLTNDPDFEVINKECYGGNLRGIIEKLDYLKTLNVKIIYLSPIFYAESYHKYNTADFNKVDPMFGTEADLKELILKAKGLGMQVILDGVFNHVGADSVYFNKYGKFVGKGAYQSLDSKYKDWFNFKDWPDSYECWWGVPSLPCVNEGNKAYRKLITGEGGVIEKYMGFGLGGFRLDVVDELTDDFLTEICQKIYSCNKNALIIGEVWEDASKKISYDARRHYLWGNQLNSVTNYPLKNAILQFLKTGSRDEFENCLNIISDDYPAFVQHNLMNIIGSHDTSRIINEIEKINSKNALKLLKMATLLEYVFVGIPTIYYGDEVGCKNIKGEISRTPYPWGKENATILDWFVKLGILRKNPAVAYGTIELLDAPSGVIVLKRTYKEKTVIAVVNNSSEMCKINTDEEFYQIITGASAKSSEHIVDAGECLVLAN